MQALIYRACCYHTKDHTLIVWIASIRDKNRQTVLDIIPAQDMELRGLIRKYQAQASISKHDVVSGEHPNFSTQCQTDIKRSPIDGEDGELGSGSDSEAD